jgi:hypothetical protein
VTGGLTTRGGRVVGVKERFPETMSFWAMVFVDGKEGSGTAELERTMPMAQWFKCPFLATSQGVRIVSLRKSLTVELRCLLGLCTQAKTAFSSRTVISLAGLILFKLNPTLSYLHAFISLLRMAVGGKPYS